MENGCTTSCKLEHLKMIQDVISRMSRTSLQIKCWVLTIVSAALVLSSPDSVTICIVPVILFGLLDAKYLSLEKGYRELYDDVRQRSDSDIDYSMQIEDGGILRALLSWSVLPFYGILIAVLAVISKMRVSNLSLSNSFYNFIFINFFLPFDSLIYELIWFRNKFCPRGD